MFRRLAPLLRALACVLALATPAPAHTVAGAGQTPTIASIPALLSEEKEDRSCKSGESTKKFGWKVVRFGVDTLKFLIGLLIIPIGLFLVVIGAVVQAVEWVAC